MVERDIILDFENIHGKIRGLQGEGRQLMEKRKFPSKVDKPNPVIVEESRKKIVVTDVVTGNRSLSLPNLNDIMQKEGMESKPYIKIIMDKAYEDNPIAQLIVTKKPTVGKK